MASMENSSPASLTHSSSFHEPDSEITGFPHSFDRSTGATGTCIVCKEPVSFFNAHYCNGKIFYFDIFF